MLFRSGRKALTLGQFRLEQQGGISVVLVHIVDFPSVQGILLMQGAGEDQCQVSVLLLVEYIGVLGESFVAVGAYTYLIRVCQRHFAMTDLSAVAVFRKHFDACLENVAVAHVCPAVHPSIRISFSYLQNRYSACRIPEFYPIVY